MTKLPVTHPWRRIKRCVWTQRMMGSCVLFYLLKHFVSINRVSFRFVEQRDTVCSVVLCWAPSQHWSAGDLRWMNNWATYWFLPFKVLCCKKKKKNQLHEATDYSKLHQHRFQQHFYKVNLNLLYSRTCLSKPTVQTEIHPFIPVVCSLSVTQATLTHVNLHLN